MKSMGRIVVIVKQCSIDYQSIYAYDYIYTYRVTLSVTYKDDA